MPTVETFHKSLSMRPECRDSYLNSLTALTRLTPSQIHALTGDMIWMDWF
jgi:hypothetical protein